MVIVNGKLQCIIDVTENPVYQGHTTMRYIREWAIAVKEDYKKLLEENQRLKDKNKVLRRNKGEV